MKDSYDQLFTIPDRLSGIKVESYKFDRYTDALEGFSKMLEGQNTRINIRDSTGRPE